MPPYALVRPKALASSIGVRPGLGSKPILAAVKAAPGWLAALGLDCGSGWLKKGAEGTKVTLLQSVSVGAPKAAVELYKEEEFKKSS